MKTSVNQFLSYCESNDPSMGIEIIKTLIDTISGSNPERTDMCRADWLNYIINEYVCVHKDGGIDFEHKSGCSDLELYMIFND